MMGVLFFLTNNKNLKEICVGSLGLEKGSLGLLDTRWQRELDFGVVHLLNKRSAGLASFDTLKSRYSRYMLWVPDLESYLSQIPKFLIFKGFFSVISSTETISPVVFLNFLN